MDSSSSNHGVALRKCFSHLPHFLLALFFWPDEKKPEKDKEDPHNEHGGIGGVRIAITEAGNRFRVGDSLVGQLGGRGEAPLLDEVVIHGLS